MDHTPAIAVRQAITLSPDLVRRALIYICAAALIGAGYVAPQAAASTACLASTAYMAAL